MRQPFSHGKHGRKCRRKNCQGSGKSYGRKASCGAVCLLRRGENAGRNRLPDADGQDLCGLKKTQRCRASLHQCSDQSNHRRGDGKLCHAGGYYSCRTRCTHWFCRAESHRADHPSEASKGLSEVRISSGTRLYRPDCRAKGYERNTGTASENALRECCR